MPIDDCPCTFEKLASEVLPAHFTRLDEARKSARDARVFDGHKSATRELLSLLNLTDDFPGCYVFYDGETPVYVGISRTVVKRLSQHLNQDSHYSASLVYKMASEDYPHEMKRDQAMKDEQFRRVFFDVQERLRSMRVAYIEIDNDLEMYLFEVYAAMQLDTATWNTFRTH